MESKLLLSLENYQTTDFIEVNHMTIFFIFILLFYVIYIINREIVYIFHLAYLAVYRAILSLLELRV
jgi:hypothetical protein